MAGNFEDSDYGLFAYILLRGEPVSRAEQARCLALVTAYARGLQPVSYYRDVLEVPMKALNVIYWPLRSCGTALRPENYSQLPVSLHFANVRAGSLFTLLAEAMDKEISGEEGREEELTVEFRDAPADLAMVAAAKASGSRVAMGPERIRVTVEAAAGQRCAVFEHDGRVDFAIPAVEANLEFYLSSYDYARSSLILSRLRGLTSRGPFIVASRSMLSRPETIGDGAEVFIVDLSRVSEEMFPEVLGYFQQKVADNPRLWAKGFDWELIRIHVCSALRMHGAQVLAAMDYTRDFFGLIKDAAAAPGPRK
ncbi:MAG: hypothetical protein ACOY4W_08315 [Thermodesulfobacteriota bacterium]